MLEVQQPPFEINTKSRPMVPCFEHPNLDILLFTWTRDGWAREETFCIFNFGR